MPIVTFESSVPKPKQRESYKYYKITKSINFDIALALVLVKNRFSNAHYILFLFLRSWSVIKFRDENAKHVIQEVKYLWDIKLWQWGLSPVYNLKARKLPNQCVWCPKMGLTCVIAPVWRWLPKLVMFIFIINVEPFQGAHCILWKDLISNIKK